MSLNAAAQQRLEKIKRHCSKFVCICSSFSTQDPPFIQPNTQELFEFLIFLRMFSLSTSDRSWALLHNLEKDMFCGKHDEEEIFNVPNAAGMEKWTQDSEICDLMGSVVISDYTLNKKMNHVEYLFLLLLVKFYKINSIKNCKSWPSLEKQHEYSCFFALECEIKAVPLSQLLTSLEKDRISWICRIL